MRESARQRSLVCVSVVGCMSQGVRDLGGERVRGRVWKGMSERMWSVSTQACVDTRGDREQDGFDGDTPSLLCVCVCVYTYMCVYVYACVHVCACECLRV